MRRMGNGPQQCTSNGFHYLCVNSLVVMVKEGYFGFFRYMYFIIKLNLYLYVHIPYIIMRSTGSTPSYQYYGMK